SLLLHPFSLFFFNDPAPSDLSTLSLHDALPICPAYAIRDFLSRNGYPFEWVDAGRPDAVRAVLGVAEVESSALPLCILPDGLGRSEEHTSELQSRGHLVCRLLLEKKKKVGPTSY